MHSKQVFDQDAALSPDHGNAQPRGNPGRAVIVELTVRGAPRIRQAPPGVLVMVAESKEITTAGGRTVATGGCGEVLSPSTDKAHHGTEARQIQVEFPG